MTKDPASLAVCSVLACHLVVVSPSVAQEESSETGGASVASYLPILGAPDEALELTAALACAPSAATATDRPEFGASFSLLVFEPSSPVAAVSRDVRLSSASERLQTVTVPYALFGPEPLIATIEDFSVQGPCEVVSSLRQVEGTSGRTRSDIKEADKWRANSFAIEIGNLPSAFTDDRGAFGEGTGIPLSGSADETMQFIFAAVCVANADDAQSGDARLSLRLIATEPTGAVSPLSVNVKLYDGSPAPRHREHILLARQVGVPYDHFYFQSGPVLFQIRDVETAPGCHMLPVVAQRADTDTGETKGRHTPFFSNYRPQFYFR